MKRQDRLSLFFERECIVLDEVFTSLPGFAGLYFSAKAPPRFKSLQISHFFTASSRQVSGTDVVFTDTNWPLPNDFFDVIVLDHPLDFGFEFKETLKEILRVLRQDGTLLITGFNRTRLCSWPIQNTFGQETACTIKRYSSLELLSLLDEAGFVTKVRHFDFCRFHLWNAIFSRIVPFLGIGFVIIAKRQTVNLKPLDEMSWNFSPKAILNPVAQPECSNQKKQHG